jgi:hypothetical protein
MNGFGTSPLELIAADAMLREEIYCEWFVYSAQFLAGTAQALIATTGQATQQTSIDADSDFIVQMMQLSVRDNAGANVVAPNMSILIIAAGSGRQIMDTAVPVTNICGNFGAAQVPSVMTFPRLFGAKGTVTTQMFNREAFAPLRVEVNYVGFKVFYTSNKTRQQIFHVL